jgi:segregation and condensation protein B
MDDNQIKYFIEAALLAAGRPMNIDQLQKLFDDDAAPEKTQIRQAISNLLDDYEERGLTITEVASGFRIQIEGGMSERLQKLWEERPPRYSRALFETMALIAYRQPMTRGEIEEIRGVAVSSNIIRSLLERDWVRVVGHRDVPGRPEMFGTTKQFLDYFGLKRLDDLPPLADLSDWESLRVQLNLPAVEDETGAEIPLENADATNIPLLLPEGDEGDVEADDEIASSEDEAIESSDQEIPDIETALSMDAGFEPIEATEWPDPEVGDTVVKVLDPDDEDLPDDQRDADASLTGA